MLYVYTNKMMIVIHFVLNLVMLEDMDDEFKCGQMNYTYEGINLS